MTPLTSKYAEVIDGAELRAQREEVGKTLRQVAAEIGHPGAYTFLHRLERGQRYTCTPEFAWRLAFALELTPRQFKSYFRLHGEGDRAA